MRRYLGSDGRILKTDNIKETIIIRLLVALVDGTVIDEMLPNHEADDVDMMVKETEDSLLVRVEIEDSRGNLTYQYKRKSKHAY